MISQLGTRQVSRVSSQPAPVRGLDAYDSLVTMPEGYAITLRNLFAQPYGCQVRRGFVLHQTGLPSAIETLMSHNFAAADAKLYAFSNNKLFDVTTANGTPSDLTGALTITNNRWQHINFPNIAGVHMVAVNGADDMLWFEPDGTTITPVVAGDGTGDTISGVDPANLIDVYSHQKRLWFVEKDSSLAWYLPSEQITGVAQSFNPGINWTRGGYLNQIITWTIDDGNGADDHLVFISSMGEVSVYQGIDPSSVDTWSLQGVYYAGAPVGRRAAVRYGGDIAIVTQHGLVMLSSLLQSTKVNPTDQNQGRMVQQLISANVSLNGSDFGWQPFVFPGANMFLINMPANNGSHFQLAMNDITMAWSEFIGYNAKCWELHNELPFFGDADGRVCRAWEQFTDAATVVGSTVTPGDDIQWEVQTAFSQFGSPGQQKHFKMVRPIIMANGRVAVSIACQVEYTFKNPLAPVSLPSAGLGIWDSAVWGGAVWDGGLVTYKRWAVVQGIGTSASLRMLGRSNDETYFASLDWLHEVGGVM